MPTPTIPPCDCRSCSNPRRKVLKLQFDRDIDAVKHRDLVRSAGQSPFGARTVVPLNIDDKGVAELAKVFDSLNHPADLMVGICRKSREDIGLTDEQTFLTFALFFLIQ